MADKKIKSIEDQISDLLKSNNVRAYALIIEADKKVNKFTKGEKADVINLLDKCKSLVIKGK